MQIFNGCQHCLFGIKIPIVAGAFLPKPKTELAGAFPNGQLFKKLLIGLCEFLFDAIGERAFDGKQIVVNLGIAFDRINEKMNMIGHEDKSP